MKNFTIIILLLASMNIFAQTTSIPDANFEQALIDLGYDTGTPDGTVPTANISGLTSLDVSSKNISDLTGIEDFVSLTELGCNNNSLNNLNVSNINTLNILWCGNNSINSLDVSLNTNLVYLDCRTNSLTSLVIPNSIHGLHCYNNFLTSLDLSVQLGLTELDCHNNLLTYLDVRNGNNVNISNGWFDASNNPDLTCIYVDNKNASYLNDWGKDATATFVETQAECDALPVKEITKKIDFVISPNPTKNNFSITTTSKIESIKLYDIYGKLIKVYSEKNNYSVSGLPSGVYLVHVKTETSIFISKLNIN